MTPRGERVVQLTCSPRRDTADADLEFFVSLIDVTERRRLEEAREDARREHAELVRRMFMLQEAERRRIAQDIHDDLGQQVTALRLKLEWLADASSGITRGSGRTSRSSAKRPLVSISTSTSCCATCARPASTTSG